MKMALTKYLNYSLNLFLVFNFILGLSYSASQFIKYYYLLLKQLKSNFMIINLLNFENFWGQKYTQCLLSIYYLRNLI